VSMRFVKRCKKEWKRTYGVISGAVRMSGSGDGGCPCECDNIAHEDFLFWQNRRTETPERVYLITPSLVTACPPPLPITPTATPVSSPSSRTWSASATISTANSLLQKNARKRQNDSSHLSTPLKNLHSSSTKLASRPQSLLAMKLNPVVASYSITGQYSNDTFSPSKFKLPTPVLPFPASFTMAHRPTSFSQMFSTSNQRPSLSTHQCHHLVTSPPHAHPPSAHPHFPSPTPRRPHSPTCPSHPLPLQNPTNHYHPTRGAAQTVLMAL
jgi:hypothetical protein